MRNLKSTLLILIAAPLLVQCTSTRWTITDHAAVREDSRSELISSRHEVVMGVDPTPASPFLTLTLYRIEDRQVTRRVLAERELQYYRPRWGFAAIAGIGAGFALYAGSKGGFTGSGSFPGAMAYNAAGLLLSLVAVTNMEPEGDPIRTGETRYLRESGFEIRPDTVAAAPGEVSGTSFELDIHFEGELLSSHDFHTNGEREWVVRLPDLFRDRTITEMDPGEIEVSLRQEGREEVRRLPVNSFLQPLVVVTSPVAELRARPEFDDQNPFTILGNGSQLQLIDRISDQWFEVRFGGSRLFLSSESAEIQWSEAALVSQPSVIPVGEVPFGEISVEFSIPVLKQDGSRDAAVLISNHRMNRLGVRRHLERDLRLMEAYFSDSFRIPESRLIRIYSSEHRDIELPGIDMPDGEGILYVYISGFASLSRQGENPTIQLIRMDDTGEVHRQDLEPLLRSFSESGAEKVVVFADLDFHHLLVGESLSGNGLSAYRALASAIDSEGVRSALIFASRPDQRSGLYESLRFEMKYHHIFPYYLAQGLQQRRTRLSRLLPFVESQVDYTSRRLHNTPQTVYYFGDLEIDLAD